MRKFYGKNINIDPSSPAADIDEHLSLLLPATILALAVALPKQDRQVLAYLISCSGYTSKNNLSSEHLPEFECSCFTCYMSYWIRWNSSPNRDIMHDIIDAYEDGLLQMRRSCSNPSHKELEEKKVTTFQGEEDLEKTPSSSVRKIVSFLGVRAILGCLGYYLIIFIKELFAQEVATPFYLLSH